MIVVLAIDALEYELVEKFDCKNLKQKFYGKTDISDFSQPRTMVLWSSFITGENKEKEVLINGNKEMWNKKWSTKETFFSKFKNPSVIDLPSFSYDLEAHEQSRNLLKKFFESKSDEEKEKIRKKYNEDAFSHHRKIKRMFLESLEKNHDLVVGYFSIVDVIGHLNFGNAVMMKLLYREMDDLAKICQEKSDKLLVLSDHGMKAIGYFGDHSDHGFWSTNWKDLGRPKIQDIGKEIVKVHNEN